MDETITRKSERDCDFLHKAKISLCFTHIQTLDLEGKLVADAARRLDTSVGSTVPGTLGQADVVSSAVVGAGEVNLLGQGLNLSLLLLQLLLQLLQVSWVTSWVMTVVWVSSPWVVRSSWSSSINGTSGGGWSWSVAQDNGGQKSNEQNDGDDSHGCGFGIWYKLVVWVCFLVCDGGAESEIEPKDCRF